MPGVEQVVGVGEEHASRPTGEQRGEELLEVLLHVVERGAEDGDDLLVHRLDDPLQLLAAVLHVLELLLQEVVALEQRVVLLERERVDRAHEPQLALEVPGPPGARRALGHLGRGRVERERRLAVEVGADALDDGLEPHPVLGVVDLAALLALAEPASSRSSPDRSVRSASSWPPAALARSAWRRRSSRSRSSTASMRAALCRRAGRRPRRTPAPSPPARCGSAPRWPSPPGRGRGGPRRRRAAPMSTDAPLVERGGAHLELDGGRPRPRRPRCADLLERAGARSRPRPRRRCAPRRRRHLLSSASSSAARVIPAGPARRRAATGPARRSGRRVAVMTVRSGCVDREVDGAARQSPSASTKPASRRASVACEPGQLANARTPASGLAFPSAPEPPPERARTPPGPAFALRRSSESERRARGAGPGCRRAARRSTARRAAASAVDDDRVHRVAERGRHRGLGPGFDLQVVEQAAGDARRCRPGGAASISRRSESRAWASASARACQRPASFSHSRQRLSAVASAASASA